MNKHKSNKMKENSNTVRHLIMGQITTTQNLVAIKEVRHAGQWQHCHSQWWHYGGCWWPGTYVAQGHLHPTWWYKPVCTLFFSRTVHVHYSWFRKMTSREIFNQSRCTLSVAADNSVATAIRSNKLQHTCAYVVMFSVWYNSSRIIMAECFSFSQSEPSDISRGLGHTFSTFSLTKDAVKSLFEVATCVLSNAQTTRLGLGSPLFTAALTHPNFNTTAQTPLSTSEDSL